MGHQGIRDEVARDRQIKTPKRQNQQCRTAAAADARRRVQWPEAGLRHGAGGSMGLAVQSSWCARRELGMVQLDRDYENVVDRTLEEGSAYRVVEAGLCFDRLREEVSDEPESVDVGELDLQGPASDVEGRQVGVLVKLGGDEH